MFDAYLILLAKVRGTPYHIRMSCLSESPIIIEESYVDYTHRFGEEHATKTTREYSVNEYLEFAHKVQKLIRERREKEYNNKLDGTLYRISVNDVYKPVFSSLFGNFKDELEQLLPKAIGWPTVKVMKLVVNTKERSLGTFIDKLEVNGNRVDLRESNKYYYIIFKDTEKGVFATISIKKFSKVRDMLYQIVCEGSNGTLRNVLSKLMRYKRHQKNPPKSLL